MVFIKGLGGRQFGSVDKVARSPRGTGKSSNLSKEEKETIKKLAEERKMADAKIKIAQRVKRKSNEAKFAEKKLNDKVEKIRRDIEALRFKLDRLDTNKTLSSAEIKRRREQAREEMEKLRQELVIAARH